MKRRQGMTKMILESIEKDKFHCLKAKYEEEEDEIGKRDFGEHLFDCFKNKWIAKVWEFDVSFPLPQWAEKQGNYRYIIILTTAGQTWLDYIREIEKDKDIEQIKEIYDSFEL